MYKKICRGDTCIECDGELSCDGGLSCIDDFCVMDPPECDEGTNCLDET